MALQRSGWLGPDWRGWTPIDWVGFGLVGQCWTLVGGLLFGSEWLGVEAGAGNGFVLFYIIRLSMLGNSKEGVCAILHP